MLVGSALVYPFSNDKFDGFFFLLESHLNLVQFWKIQYMPILAIVLNCIVFSPPPLPWFRLTCRDAALQVMSPSPVLSMLVLGHVILLSLYETLRHIPVLCVLSSLLVVVVLV